MPDIPKAYEPQSVEEKWYQFWLDQKCFVADSKSSKPAYSIVIPPPNVTGMLHMGHVLNNTIQDILARKARMEGKEVLWLPGTDHAGIATQTAVERDLRKQGLMKHREDIGREKFLEHVWAWKEKHGGIIIQQLKKLGCSCDWTRERFTMDPEYSRCVQKVFVDLYKKGLIYRGKRMVNWDPAACTALSDEEVEMVEEKGQLWHIKYPLLDEKGQRMRDEFVVVATTRPETMLGDEAVAVNPNDPRYTKLIGQKCLLPLQDKPIPIIADDFVDPKFGTGCVKVTPAHDPNDYEMGLRHKLPVTTVIAPDGTMTKEAGEDFIGLDRMEARTAVVEELTEHNLLLKVDDYVHNVGYSQRSHVPIEPYLSEQWFMKYPSVEASTKAVEEGRIKFYPERWTKTYGHWMHKIKDWCISRQLWWGHRVPVWRPGPNCTRENQQSAAAILSEAAARTPEHVVVRELLVNSEPQQEPQTWEAAIASGQENLEAALTNLGFKQDSDVLDTWASSWLWPFATMGWPEQTETLKKFYPTTDLVTGPDIIFFWVARMIMAGYEYMGDLPFHNVYFTGIIRDKNGDKMSKSLGNSPDPLVLIDKYGTDAVRFGIMRAVPLGQDLIFEDTEFDRWGKTRYEFDKIPWNTSRFPQLEIARNFCNKLWNACRFRQMQGGEVQGEIDRMYLTTDDKWILLKLDQAIREINDAFTEYRFNEVAQVLYRFFWSEYCDWYVEASKAILSHKSDGTSTSSYSPEQLEKRRVNKLAVLDFVLSHTLCLFHPFLPFITEELWHGMGFAEDMPENQGGKTIMFAPWPKPLDEDIRGHWGLDDCYLEMGDTKYDLVRKGRDLRREAKIPAGKKVKYVIKPGNQPIPPYEAEVIKLLLNAESLDINPDYNPPKGTPTVHSEIGELYLSLEGAVDTEAEKARLKKELEKAELEITKVQERLANPAFTQKAPPNVLGEHQKRLLEWQTKREHILSALSALDGDST